MAIAVLLGIAFALMEQNEKVKAWAPSPTGVGLGMILPFIALTTLLIGGVLGALWTAIAPRSASVYLVPLASGFIAGEALIAVFVPVLLWAGFSAG